jgi:hypothetical protein
MMNSASYKAFISYSHQDEVWASWLHRALESYKIPKHLRSDQVPDRLFPIFRDRDELSSGADLNEKVQDALRDSESLIVICSPASAQSRWVNEEIRSFRSMGRGDRIFCLIVDGDPQATRLEEASFPPALLEGGVGETIEPLAADARKWADGKPLAKLKLISGVLGLRLDELRQREQARKRKQKVLTGIAVFSAVALIVSTVISKTAEKTRRQQAETLVTQIVDISQGLNSVVDLETLQTIGERLMSYLDTLDSRDLTPESNKQIALVLRQLGSVSKAQARLGDAMEAFTQSRSILARQSELVPENLDFLFELGNAEFYVASIHIEQHEFGLAEIAFHNYRNVASKLLEFEPQNPAWIMELSYAHTNLAALAERSDQHRADEALSHGTSAVGLLEQVLELEPDNNYYKSQYVGTLSWYADAQMQVCDIRGALGSRQKNERMARELKLLSPANREFQEQHAYALTGLAIVKRQSGSSEEAMQLLAEAKRLLVQLVQLDPSNLKYQWEVLRRRAYIADLGADMVSSDQVMVEMADIQVGLKTLLQAESEAGLRRKSQYSQFLLNYSDAAARNGEKDLALRLINEAATILDSTLVVNSTDRNSLDQISRAEFQWWQHKGDIPHPQISRYARDLLEGGFKAEGCQRANISARQAILRGNMELALAYTTYLFEKGFFDPDYKLFCRQYALCEE